MKLTALLVLPLAATAQLGQLPENPTRYSATLDWCDCGQGAGATANLTIWPDGNKSAEVVVSPSDGALHWLSWGYPVSKIGWKCDGMIDDQTSSFNDAVEYWSVQHTIGKKPFCSSESGRLTFVGWNRADYNTSVVYASGESGYVCIKIPVLVLTQKGTLLAIAEARKDSCSDFAWTDLVIKRSFDHGRSWSAMQVIRSESAPGTPKTVIGNAAPVQLSHSGRILIPHTRNNTDVWLTYSDDDGATWSKAHLIPNVTLPGWAWVGTGPPGSIELQSGRVLVPTYHGKLRGNVLNNQVHGNVMTSDDAGQTWVLRSEDGFGAADKYSNENQAVQLSNGSVLINARSLANPGDVQRRIQTISNDEGQSFGPTRYVQELRQPIDGCEGSIISLGSAEQYVNGSVVKPPRLILSNPDSTLLRTNLKLFVSANEGSSWEEFFTVDPGMAGYSSLQASCDSTIGACNAYLLYEQSDSTELVMNPDRFIFRSIPIQRPQPELVA